MRLPVLGASTCCALGFVLASEARDKPQVTFESPCVCRGNHGVARWSAKTDPREPPLDGSGIKSITPAEMLSWPGPGGNIPRGGGRTAAEEQWYAITGRVSKLRAEEDGDLHIQLENVDGSSGEVVIEIPLGEQWCQLRQIVFTWTDARFPLSDGTESFSTDSASRDYRDWSRVL